MIEQGRPNSNAAFKGGDMEFALVWVLRKLVAPLLTRGERRKAGNPGAVALNSRIKVQSYVKLLFCRKKRRP